MYFFLVSMRYEAIACTIQLSHFPAKFSLLIKPWFFRRKIMTTVVFYVIAGRRRSVALAPHLLFMFWCNSSRKDVRWGCVGAAKWHETKNQWIYLHRLFRSAAVSVHTAHTSLGADGRRDKSIWLMIVMWNRRVRLKYAQSHQYHANKSFSKLFAGMGLVDSVVESFRAVKSTVSCHFSFWRKYYKASCLTTYS